MKYTVIIKKSVSKSGKKIPKPIRAKIFDAIANLEDNPYPTGCIKLEGQENKFRIRIGQYRVIYQIQNEKLIVFILRIAHRSSAYSK